MALAMLRDWCRWMGANAQRSLLLLGIPEDCAEDEFQEAVRASLWPLGRCREAAGPGAEPFEAWVEHAYDVMHLWHHLSDSEMKRRLVDCLSGPALDVLCTLLAEDPTLSMQDCLVAMVQVFGTQDSCMASRIKFLTCTQQPGETLFEYLMRLEGLLQTAMEKGAVHPSVADQVRMRQVLTRGHPNLVLYNKLRRIRVQGRAPDFVELLQLIQESEEMEEMMEEVEEPPQERRLVLQLQQGPYEAAATSAAAQLTPLGGYSEQVSPPDLSADLDDGDINPDDEGADSDDEGTSKANLGTAGADPDDEGGAEANLDAAGADPDDEGVEPDDEGADSDDEGPAEANLGAAGTNSDDEGSVQANLDAAGANPDDKGAAQAHPTAGESDVAIDKPGSPTVAAPEADAAAKGAPTP
ncbi:paraneoplastic antigen-like protein 6B [Tenrec ecaudatus]|uniref:paraneoplastic antigen-like protein 6B n=1 Tax=Tenrec ecaudatus TaxID=94439 RepID=UPI003F5924DB